MIIRKIIAVALIAIGGFGAFGVITSSTFELLPFIVVILLMSIGINMLRNSGINRTTVKNNVDSHASKSKQMGIDFIGSNYYGSIKYVSHIRNYTEMPNEFVVLDVETTGLESTTDSIVEIAMITYKDGQVVDVYNQLINPGVKIPAEASRINGITNLMVKNSPKLADVIHEIYERMNNKIVVGYNVEFDLKFIGTALARNNLSIDNLKIIDVLQLVKETISSKEIANRKLETVKRYFQIVSGSHRALADCEVTFEVFKKCIKIKENFELQRKADQDEKLSKLNEFELQFISALEEHLSNINLKERLNYTVMSDKTINFQIDQMQIGRVKLSGKKFKMQILDKNNVLWLDIDDHNEAISNIKHWIKYSQYLVQ